MPFILFWLGQIFINHVHGILMTCWTNLLIIDGNIVIYYTNIVFIFQKIHLNTIFCRKMFSSLYYKISNSDVNFSHV
jgi:hypothetical protein